jgi:acyl dehydratase
MGLDEWRIHKPVKHGDTIEVATTPIEKRLTSKGGRGIVIFNRDILNQHGETVHSMKSSNMYLCRP